MAPWKSLIVDKVIVEIMFMYWIVWNESFSFFLMFFQIEPNFP